VAAARDGRRVGVGRVGGPRPDEVAHGVNGDVETGVVESIDQPIASLPVRFGPGPVRPSALLGIVGRDPSELGVRLQVRPEAVGVD